MLGVASPVTGDMVRITLASPDGNSRFHQALPVGVARAMANALYEAAEAAEAMPQTVVAASERLWRPSGRG